MSASVRWVLGDCRWTMGSGVVATAPAAPLWRGRVAITGRAAAGRAAYSASANRSFSFSVTFAVMSWRGFT